MNRPAAATLVVAVAVGGCGSRDTPAAQLARGSDVYARQCRGCHDVPGAIGVTLTERVIGSFGTADRLLGYLRVAMPYDAPGSLSPEAYRDVVAYLASNRGTRMLPLIIDSAAAARVSLLEFQVVR